jgi:hypothetical protein
MAQQPRMATAGIHWGRDGSLMKEVSYRTFIRIHYANDDTIQEALAKLLTARDALLQLNGLLDTSAIDLIVTQLSALVGSNPIVESKPKRGEGVERRGRRRGDDGDWIFKYLVSHLLDITRRSNADLKLSKTGNVPGGNLVTALELMRPYVDCIPNVLPYKTLERLHSSDSLMGSPLSLDVLRRMAALELRGH